MGTMKLVVATPVAAIANVCTRFWQNDWASFNNTCCYRQTFRWIGTVWNVFVVLEFKLSVCTEWIVLFVLHWGLVCARVCVWLWVWACIYPPKRVRSRFSVSTTKNTFTQLTAYRLLYLKKRDRIRANITLDSHTHTHTSPKDDVNLVCSVGDSIDSNHPIIFRPPHPNTAIWSHTIAYHQQMITIMSLFQSPFTNL